MHIIENYSRRAGALIDKPFIIEQFYPIEAEKYITISNSSGMEGKNYSYFQDVVDFILPQLQSLGIAIIQIGNKDDIGLDGATHLHGKTSLNQTAYILKNAILHVGNDSFPVHLASSYDIGIVALYSVSPPEVCGPYWGTKSNQVLLSPDFSNKLPSYNPKESPKRSDEIAIEDVINGIYKLLKIDENVPTSLYIGERYTNQVVELIPDQILRKDFVPHLVINIRGDLIDSFDENVVLHNIHSRKCSLVINRKFNNIDGLFSVRENLPGFFYDITEYGVDIDFLQNLIKRGLPPQIVYRSEDLNKFNEAKIQLLDFKIPSPRLISNKNNLDKFTKLLDNVTNNSNDVLVKSNRVILAKGKVYLSIQHYKEDKPTTTKEQKLDLQHPEELTKEHEFYYIYEYGSKKKIN
jgi:hypothetical protein